MNEIEVRASKFLSLLLRHNPGEIGLLLGEDGWALVSDIVERTKGRRLELTQDLIELVVVSNDKQRFQLSADRQRIRASQGHSIPVDLGLQPQAPPPLLYHGTATRFGASIRSQGLLKGSRQHVHLSIDRETARMVGQRHGQPLVLQVKAGQMHENGYDFYLSENGVWLTDHVPVSYLLET